MSRDGSIAGRRDDGLGLDRDVALGLEVGIDHGQGDPRIALELGRPATADERVDEDPLVVERIPDDGLVGGAVGARRRDDGEAEGRREEAAHGR